MKDYFSTHSGDYVKFRPTYPAALFDFLKPLVPSRQAAWDCGTGNGQVAIELAKFFERVYATDISRAQLEKAFQAANIEYSVQPAEQTNFPDRSFDLIIVAQAVHWFNFDKFYREVRRTAKEDAVLCLIGYGRIEISPRIDPVISDFYTNKLRNYWDEERKYIDEGYQTIPFPFEEIPAPQFEMEQRWSFEHLIGYLNTWSVVKHFIKRNQCNPIDALEVELKKHWEDGTLKAVKFPVLLRIGRIK